MNPVVRAQMEQFKTSNPIEGYSFSEYFEVYSIFSIVNGYVNDNIDPFEMHLKGHEFGLDGCGITVQGELVDDSDTAASAMESNRDAKVNFTFVQSKTSEAFEYGEISKFLDAVFGFFNGDMTGESPQLNDLMAAKDAIYNVPLRKNPDLSCFFVSTGKYEPVSRIEKLLEANRTRFNDLNLFDNIRIELIDARTLQEAYRAATSSNSQEIEFTKSQTMPPHPCVEQAYIGYLRGDEILKLATTRAGNEDFGQMNQSVFFDNIRDFNPASKLNEKIIDDIINGDRNGFVFRNNGITVVAKKINRTGDRFNIEDYQIVNGCQTSNILFQCRDKADELFIPFRLIGARDDSFITSIIVGTNSQNVVRDEQFWALRPFMKDLEEYCKQQPSDFKLFLERRENQYREENIERTRVVKPSDLMKAVAAMYLFQPHRAARDFRGIRAEYDGEIFQSEHSVVPYHLACYANYKFEFLIRNRRINRGNKIYKYYILFALGYQHCGKRSIFSMKRSQQNSICEEIKNVLESESAFTAFCEDISAKLNDIGAAKFGLDAENTPRERLRDALRAESFSMEFRQHL